MDTSTSTWTSLSIGLSFNEITEFAGDYSEEGETNYNTSAGYISDVEETTVADYTRNISLKEERFPNAIAYPYIPLAIIGCFTNFLVLLAILTTKKLHTTAMAFIASLSIIDGLYATCIHPFHIHSMMLGYWSFSPAWCKAVAVLTWYAEGADFWGIVMMTLNRYFAVAHPLKYRAGVLNNKIIIACMITGQYTIPLIVLIPVYLVVDSDEHVGYTSLWSKCSVLPVNLTGSARNFVNTFHIFIPLVLIIILYSFIVRAVRVRKRRIADIGTVDANETRNFNTEIKLTKIAAISIAYYIVCYIPFLMTRLITGHVTIPRNVSRVIAVTNRLAWFTNSFVYAILMKQFRRAFIRILCCGWCRKSQRVNFSATVSGHSTS